MDRAKAGIQRLAVMPYRGQGGEVYAEAANSTQAGTHSGCQARRALRHCSAYLWVLASGPAVLADSCSEAHTWSKIAQWHLM